MKQSTDTFRSHLVRLILFWHRNNEPKNLVPSKTCVPLILLLLSTVVTPAYSQSIPDLGPGIPTGICTDHSGNNFPCREGRGSSGGNTGERSGSREGRSGTDDRYYERQRREEKREEEAERIRAKGFAESARGDWAKAEIYFRKSIRKCGSANAYVDLSQALLKQGKYEEAIAFTRGALQTYFHDPRLANNLGVSLYRSGRHDEALYYFDLACDWAYRSSGDVSFCQNSSAIRRSLDAEQWFKKGLVFWQNGDYSAMQKAFRKAIENKPTWAAFYNLGLALYKQQNYAEAVIAFENALKLDPSDANTRDQLENSQTQLALQRKLEAARVEEERRKAEQWAEEARVVDETFSKGLQKGNQRNYVGMEQEFRKVIELRSNSSTAYTNLGVALHNQGRYAEAIDAYQKAIELDASRKLLSELFSNIKPESDHAQQNLESVIAWLSDSALSDRFTQANVEELEAALRQVIKLQPADFQAQLNLAYALEHEGRDKEAEAQYREALRLSSLDPEARCDFGAFLEDQGRDKEAEAQYREALRIDPRNVSAHYSLGLFLADHGRSTDAIEELREAVRLDPEDPDLSASLADVIQKQKYTNRARQYTTYKQGLVTGYKGIYGLNVPESQQGTEVEQKSGEMLEGQRILAGVSKEEFMNPRDSSFIIGITRSHDLSDLIRVITYQTRRGRLSAAKEPLYASLRNRQFEQLDCHSAGAMVCLTALELRDAKARHVRLFGPQITPESLSQWQRLIEQGQVSSIELYINAGDPIPGLSYSVGSYLYYGESWPPYEMSFDELLLTSIKKRAPGISVKFLPCHGRSGYFDSTCHLLKAYQINLPKNKN